MKAVRLPFNRIENRINISSWGIRLDDDIYVMDANGKKIQNLTKHLGRDRHPAWSPNGRQIAFSSIRVGNFGDGNFDAGNYDIYVMDANGKNVRRMTEDRSDDILPAWSPNGQKIAFSSRREGNFDIYVMNADGTNVRQLTNHPADDWGPTFGFTVAFSVSPSGKRATRWGRLKQIRK